MENGGMERSARGALAFCAVLAFCMGLGLSGAAPVLAQVQPAAPAAQSAAPQETAPAPDADKTQAAPVESSAATLDVPARPVAFLAGDGEWSSGFKTVKAAIERINVALKTASLVPAGHPFAVFLSTDDEKFHFEAMVPIAEKPADRTDLTDSVKIKDSPSGKALKFLHRGAYDDIDATYDLITAFMDEKGLDSKNMFIEEYLTDTKDSDDATLEADIYVFLK